MADTFDQYAIVELFGHNVIAGRVTEQVIGGQGFVRVDVPKIGDTEGFTKLYGPGAIYAISPCDEATATAAAAGFKVKPIEVWRLHLPALTIEQDPDLIDEDFEDDEDDGE